MDSLEANDFHGSLSFGLNLTQDGTSSLVTNTDVGMLYSTKESNYQLLGSTYFNRFESFSTANRAFAMLVADIFSHDLQGKKVHEKRIYAEPFSLISYDANRGINYRWQLGCNAVYSFKSTRFIHIKLGAGALFEMENWQVVPHDSIPYLDSISPERRKFLIDTIGIDTKGRLFRNNIRANIFTNFICQITKSVNINGFINLQIPFVPPYQNLPQEPNLPVVTKRYPRITIDMTLNFKIGEVISMVTNFSMQYDKGQLPRYVPNFVYSLTQGIDVSF